MAERVYFSVFEAAVGATAHLVTRRQYETMRNVRAEDGFFAGEQIVNYCYPRRMRPGDALNAAMNAHDKWIKSNSPSVTKLREMALDHSRRGIPHMGHKSPESE
jgi:hypothetical protein